MKAVDKKRAKSAAGKIGFHTIGDFFVGVRSKDVLSGLAVDSAPSSTYMWTFVIPAFDDLSFLHMSLGNRVLNLNSLEKALENEMENAWGEVSHIRAADQLISYLDEKDIGGEYAKWTRFICLIRVGRFDEADIALNLINTLKSAQIPRKTEEVVKLRRYGGWPAVQDLLVEWSGRTDKILGDLPVEI